MRIGRTYKSLILLCVTVIPVLYVFYAKVGYTRTNTRLKVVSTNNEKKDTETSRDTILQLYRSKLKDHSLVLDSDNTSFPPNHYTSNVISQSSILDSSLVNTTSPGDVTKTKTGNGVKGEAVVSDVRMGTLSDEQQSRIRNLRLSCARHETKDCTNVGKCNLTEFYYSKQYNFAYCKVPKSGSTFWMKLFLVLYDSARYSKLMNTWSRSDIHARSKRLITPPTKIIIKEIPTVIVSRNPYSRLFSAYTDKVFMPLFWGQFNTMNGVKLLEPFWLNRTVDALKKSNQPLPERLLAYRAQMEKRGMLKKLTVTNKVTPVCANNATFEDFLKFIIAEVKAKRTLEPHWAPINKLCRPCMFNTQHIIKQEHFSEDVNKTLTSFNINSTGFEVVQQELLDRRVENSIPGIVRVIERKAAMPDVKMCTTNPEIVRRLWKAFQVQGYISDKEAVPGDLLTERFNKFKIISKAMESLKSAPLTDEQRSNQRQAYLIKAYRGISRDIIEDIQEIFRADFELFDYPLAPPV